MTVHLQRRGAVTTIVLDRPDAMNAVNAELAEELLNAIRATAGDGSRAIVLTGAGRAFCSGADLKGGGITPGEDGLPDLGKGLREGMHPVIEGLRTMPKPVIASVNGPAVGIGLSFALACDLVIAAESAYFLLAFVNIGLAPDGGASFLVPERIGFTRAAEMAMLGERIPAPKALEWGLVNRVVPDSELTAETEVLADWLAAGPTRSYAATKTQLNAWQFARFAEQLELEASLQTELGRSADFFEGVSAFVEKRPPRFTGS
ncbi:MAG TPA: enoyl-CoA hydratase-related protein [Solirubrobacter sp.]|jgi:2-(1,2-epoxy-1,2-dihydrophenyl)acetyl-CoA isomerase|nr:enoyl-CoA hydratase-related protein [Solirubrobacter sp.]